MSIRLKLFFIVLFVTATPFAFLAVYGMSQVQQSISYIYKGVGIDFTRQLTRDFQDQASQILDAARDNFQNHEQGLQSSLMERAQTLWLVQPQEMGSGYGIIKLKSRSDFEKWVKENTSSITEYLVNASKREVFVTFAAPLDLWVLFLKTSEGEMNFTLVSLAPRDFLPDFQNKGLGSSYLIDSDLKVLAKSWKASPFQLNELFANTFGEDLPEFWAGEIGDQFLSMSKMSDSQWLINTWGYDQVEASLWAIFGRLVLLFLLVLVLGFGLSFRLMDTLVRRLDYLISGLKKVSAGHFQVDVPADRADELAKLESGFSQMASEIGLLMEQEVERGRMESELKIARLVQNNFFPKWEQDEDWMEVAGYYQSASECGGDWWHYNLTDSELQFWVGDATGHGVGPAMVTSAVHSAYSLGMTELDLESQVQQFNKAIYNSAGGEIHMTFTAGRINRQSLKMTYARMGHEPIVIVPGDQDPATLNWRETENLLENSGPRLGQDPEIAIKTFERQLQPGDVILLYSDGITETTDAKGGQWRERRMIKTLLECLQDPNFTARSVTSTIIDRVEKFQASEILEDDRTLLTIKMKKTGLPL